MNLIYKHLRLVGYVVNTLNRIIDVGMCEQLEATLVQVYPEGMTET